MEKLRIHAIFYEEVAKKLALGLSEREAVKQVENELKKNLNSMKR